MWTMDEVNHPMACVAVEVSKCHFVHVLGIWHVMHHRIDA